MKHLVNYLFFELAAVLFVFSVSMFACQMINIRLPFEENAIDIQLHDTYFVVSYWHLMGGCITFLFLNALVYYLIQIRKEVHTGLVIIHFALIVVAFVNLLALPLIRSTEPNYYRTTETNLFSDIILWVTGLSFLIAVIIFLSNIAFSLFLSPRKTLSK